LLKKKKKFRSPCHLSERAGNLRLMPGGKHFEKDIKRMLVPFRKKKDAKTKMEGGGEGLPSSGECLPGGTEKVKKEEGILPLQTGGGGSRVVFTLGGVKKKKRTPTIKQARQTDSNYVQY